MAGGEQNSASGDFSTVGGGIDNVAGPTFGNTVGGGDRNEATGGDATVGGGDRNIASGGFSTVGGGDRNTATGGANTIAGGSQNSASNSWSTVGGGLGNDVTGTLATIAGGSLNTASGQHATVPGGNRCVASGDYSFAAGRRAKALSDGAFAFADATNADFLSSGPNTFNVRASGGVVILSNAAGDTGVVLFPGANAWSPLSDRNFKENFALVDGRDILERLASIPVETWNLKSQEPSIRHIGPMAQDFQAAFGVGEDETRISTTDADGVALAAIQGLYQIAQDKDEQIAELRGRLAALEALVQRLASQPKGDHQ